MGFRELAAVALLLPTFASLGCGAKDPADLAKPGPTTVDCGFLDGDFTGTPLQAANCSSDPRGCAEFLNQCLADSSSLQATQWSILDAPKGAVPASGLSVDSLRGLSHSNTITPMHGRYTTILLNPTAAEAFNQQIVRDSTGNVDSAALPDGSVLVKWNFSSNSEPSLLQLEGQPWITVMAKIEGYDQPTIGGNSIGGDWFYYLWRFGDFKQFDDAPVYGKPQAFCTDCHNPAAKSDFIWNLHLYIRGREQPYFDDSASGIPKVVTSPPAGSLPPDWVCAEGALGIGPQAPTDVPFNPALVPAGIDLQPMFDCFSWRTFTALNWPNSTAERGQADTTKSLSDLGPPRVWETFKETAEVFQPEIADWTIAEQAWNDEQDVPTACTDELAKLPAGDRAKVLQMITKTRSHQILNETHQAMGNQFNILVDQDGKILRYEVRFNRDEFEYLKENGFADTGNYSYQGPKDAEVFFPTDQTGFTGQGATEIKAAWRELCTPTTGGQCTAAEEQLAAEYYTELGLVFTAAGATSPASCRFSKVGLVGLHVIRKTFWAPQWIWATFEHRQNAPQAGGPIDDQPYLLWNASCEAPSDEYCSQMRPGSFPPQLIAKLGAEPSSGDPNCCANTQLIVNAHPGIPSADGTLQPKDPQQALVKNQITRLVEVGPQAMNARFQAQLPKPWNNYFLVNTQWPSGARQGSEGVGAARRQACNLVDLLWSTGSSFEQAGITKPECYTMEPRGAGASELKLRNTTMETFQTAWDDPGTASASQLSSQSCFNCHGFSGVDFSFAFTDGLEEIVADSATAGGGASP